MTEMKCRKCGQIKDLSEFNKRSDTKLGVNTICRECRTKICREYHEKHREQDREYNREYRKTHKESGLAQLKKYPHKRKARWMTYNFIKYSGIEKPKECSVCGQECKVEIHHPNYDKRNNIVFCCKKCHALIHRGDNVEYKTIDLLKIK